MHADEINKTGHRGCQQPEPPGPDSFGRTARVGEGWCVDSERANQLVLGDVGYDNDWRRKLQTIRELVLLPQPPSVFERAPFLTRSARASRLVGIVTSLCRFGCFFLTFVGHYGPDLLGMRTGL